MAVQYINPKSQGTYDQWYLGAGANKWKSQAKDNDSFSDGYIWTQDAAYTYQSFKPDQVAPHTSIVSWTTATGGGKNANSAYGTYGWYDTTLGWLNYGSFIYDVFIWGTHGYSVAWSPVPSDATLARPELEMMLRNDVGTAAYPIYQNYFYAIVDYNPSGGMFLPIMQLATSVIGSGLILREIPKLNAWLKRTQKFHLSDREFTEAHRQWKEFRHTRYFDLGAHKWQIGMHPL